MRGRKTGETGSIKVAEEREIVEEKESKRKQ